MKNKIQNIIDLCADSTASYAPEEEKEELQSEYRELEEETNNFEYTKEVEIIVKVFTDQIRTLEAQQR